MTAPQPRDVPPPDAVADLADRWRRARRAALAGQGAPDLPEHEALAATDVGNATRTVFRNSRILGEGFRRTWGVDATLRDLSRLLPAIAPPCPLAFEPDGPTRWRSSHAPCAAASKASCTWGREALQGLVAGMSTTSSYSRVAHPASGDPVCVDLLHLDPADPHQFVEPPPALAAALERAGARIGRLCGGRLVVQGLSGTTVHYRVDGADPSFDVASMLRSALRGDYPDLMLCDGTPRAIDLE